MIKCPYDFDSCGKHCPNWVLSNPKNKCKLQENDISKQKVTDKCPWLIPQKGKLWLCKIKDDACTNSEHYLLCARYTHAMELITDPLSQELIKKAMENES